MLPGEKEVVTALKRLWELATALWSFAESRSELASVLGKRVKLGMLPKLKPPVRVVCGTYAAFREHRFPRLRVEKYEVIAVLMGYELRLVDAEYGSTIKHVSLEKPSIEDLIVLAIMERECKLLSMLVERVKEIRRELAEHLEKARKVAAVVEMALKP